MSWYPGPPHYGHGQPPPPQDYGGYAPPPPPPQQQQQQAYPPAYGAPQAGYGGYYAPPPPPPAAAPYYGQPAYGHHHQHPHHQSPPPPAMIQQPPPPPQRYDYAPPPHQYTPPPPVVQQPPPVAQAPPPLKEGELRPPPDVAHDPNSFRRYFKLQLDQLTYNSKPVITSLTLFAHEHAIRMASVVAQCFDEHLRTCPPQYLLPAFYLLDSICKNIGAPYLALFSRFIERAFLSAYHSVDPSTRTKLEELLGTWKTGGSDGGELFRDPDEPREGARVQRGIEGALFGARGRGDGLGGRATKDAEMYHAGVQQLPHTATTTERSGVLYDVRRLLTLRQDVLSTNPADQINASQITALRKLENLILNTQLTTEQVTQIRNQLAALAPPPPPAGGRPSASPVPPAAPGQNLASALSPLVQQQQQASPQSYGGQHLSPPPPAAAQQQQQRRFSPAPPPPPPPVPAGAFGASPAPVAAAQVLPPAAPGGVVNGIDLGLLSQLSASGALANLFGGGAPASGGSPALSSVKVEAKPEIKEEEGGAGGAGSKRREKVPLVEKDEMAMVWEQEVVRMGVTLNSGELATPRPHALAVLYLQMVPLQCRQCGLRQPDSRTGKRKMDEHLDWHFVHKRRMREAAGRASGRSWFTSEEDWYTSDSTHHPLSAADQPSSSLLSAGAAATASQAGNSTIDRAALQKLKVAVPAAGSPEAELGLGDKPCPICQDRFKSEWSDEEEEWVWWNAVVVDKVLYHATCHAEAALARSNAVASAAASRTSVRTSRESTPTLAASRKRKADSVDPTGAANPTSPLKPKIEGGEAVPSNGDGELAVAGDEPDAKRVKAEPQEEHTFDASGAPTETAPEQPAISSEPAPVTESDPPPVRSSSLFLPE
ncbi:hypothetical protein JCM10908_001359 [Rhodotorula pacifica]|uniref:CTD-interacting domain-containing protein n=1 Tax=Rhodotorula pacifica TaxID=1495444 RepID=UPI00316F9BA4